MCLELGRSASVTPFAAVTDGSDSDVCSIWSGVGRLLTNGGNVEGMGGIWDEVVLLLSVRP